jgi:hypothetical protein
MLDRGGTVPPQSGGGAGGGSGGGEGGSGGGGGSPVDVRVPPGSPGGGGGGGCYSARFRGEGEVRGGAAPPPLRPEPPPSSRPYHLDALPHPQLTRSLLNSPPPQDCMVEASSFVRPYPPFREAVASPSRVDMMAHWKDHHSPVVPTRSGGDACACTECWSNPVSRYSHKMEEISRTVQRAKPTLHLQPRRVAEEKAPTTEPVPAPRDSNSGVESDRSEERPRGHSGSSHWEELLSAIDLEWRSGASGQSDGEEEHEEEKGSGSISKISRKRAKVAPPSGSLASKVQKQGAGGLPAPSSASGGGSGGSSTSSLSPHMPAVEAPKFGCATQSYTKPLVQASGRRGPRGQSRFKGVCITRAGKWRAVIYIGRKQKYLGVFDCEEDAAVAYDSSAVSYFGKGAKLNFPDAPHVPASAPPMPETCAAQVGSMSSSTHVSIPLRMT